MPNRPLSVTASNPALRLPGARPWRLAVARRIAPARVACVLMAVSVVAAAALAGCQPADPEPSATRAPIPPAAPAEPLVRRLPQTSEVRAEPTIRVRVMTQAERIDVPYRDAVHLAPATSAGRPDTGAARSFRAPLTITHDRSRFLIRDAGGQTFAWRAGSLHLRTARGDALPVDDLRYPGAVVLVALANEEGQPTGHFDVINHVAMETYLPGVLERELFPNWELEAFKAQAIAARSYALFERRLNADRHYDLQSTTASQAYGGAATNPRAIEATRQTRGMVLTHGGSVVPGFYSSACGGLTQTATSAFPRFGDAVSIGPLRGGVTCTYCQPSPNFRWGSVERDAAELADRIAAWGRANRESVAALEGLRAVRMTHRSAAGRPARFELVDQRGRRFVLPAEFFRFACNQPHPRHGALPREQQLRSSHVRVSMQGHRVRFTDGRGFGHGAGMCQWGAQGMARAGYVGRDIVSHYYPDAALRRAY